MSKTQEKKQDSPPHSPTSSKSRVVDEDTEEYDISEFTSDEEFSDEEEFQRKAKEFDDKNLKKVLDATAEIKSQKRKRREEEEDSLTPWQKASEFHNPNLRHKRLKMLEAPPISEAEMKELEDIKKRVSEFLHKVLPKDKQALANDLENIPIYTTRIEGKVIEGMVQRFNKNIVGCSYVRRLMKIPINLLMMKADVTVQEIQGGRDSIEKFTDLLLEACDILKTHKIK